MRRQNLLRWCPLLSAISAVGVAAFASPGCGGKGDDGASTPPRGYAAPADVDGALDGAFRLRIDTAHPALATVRREPQVGPVDVATVRGQGLELVARAKALSAQGDRVWVDVYLVNHGDTAFRDLALEVAGSAVADVNDDPFSLAPFAGPRPLGGVAAHGVAHAAFTVAAASGTVTVDLAFRGRATSRAATNSAPIAVTSDGKEAWSIVPDASAVAVVDTANDARVASVPVAGRPESLAITPDGARVLVACSDTNRIVVLDRATRTVVQTLDESAGVGRDVRHVVVAPDGASAFVSAYVSDTVTRLVRLEDGTFRVDGVVRVGRRPTGLAVTADGKALLAAHFLPRGTPDDNETYMTVLSTEPFAVHHETVWRDLGNRKEASCLSAKYGLPAEELLLEGVATQLAGVFLPPAGDLAWIPGLRVGPTVLWELAAGKVVPGIAPTTFSPGFVFFADARGLETTGVKRNPLVLDAPDAKLDFLRCAKLDYDTESTVARQVDGEPNAQLNNGAAVPTGASALSEAGVSRFVAFSRGGRRALVVSFAADEIQMYDAVTQHSAAKRNFLLSGSNPLGLAITPDGKKGYVAYADSLYVSVLDLSAIADPEALPPVSYVPFEYRTIGRASNTFVTEQRLVRFTEGVPDVPAITETKQVTVAETVPLAETVRRGRRLFNSSNPTKYPGLTASRQASCATCHPGGGHDGTVWGTTEGERRTMNLRGGVAGRGWLHQSGTHKDVLEFVHTVVPERLGGRDLPEEDYRLLAEYVAFHIPRLQTPKVDGARAARGQGLFAERCAGCHGGEKLTSGKPAPGHSLGGGADEGPALFDLGTATSSAHVVLPAMFTDRLPPPSNKLFALVRGDRELGDKDPVQKELGFRPRPNRARGEFRAPPLTSVWDYSIFFHDGHVARLEDAVQTINQRLGMHLDDAQVGDLCEYLKTL